MVTERRSDNVLEKWAAQTRPACRSSRVVGGSGERGR